MNYATHALDFLKKWYLPALLKASKVEDFTSVAKLTRELERSVKFLLPANASVGMQVSQAVLNLLRVPYPCVMFEYSMVPREGTWQGIEGYTAPVEPSTRRLSIVWRVSPTEEMTEFARYWIGTNELDLRGKTGMLVASVFHVEQDGKDFWGVAPGLAFVETGTQVTVRVTDRYKDGIASFEMELLHLMPDTCHKLKSDVRGQSLVQALVNDVSDEVTVAVCAVAALNAKNVHQVTIDAPAKLNAKRARSGKTPFFEYRVLDIFLGGERTVRNRDRVMSALNSLRAGCKLHGVRGHFKTRSTGIFWWSDFVRGRKTNGVIEKEYSIHNKENQK